ncbi:MAG: trypsin-like peptidase domain-containing protein [Planctomycetes bacterium]|nr:trypsin-like peptidase domain-containing protein [Planctomycetota bacterium]
MRRHIVLAILAAACASPWCGAVAASEDKGGTLADLDLVVGRAIRAVEPSVVRVKVLKMSPEQQKAAEKVLDEQSDEASPPDRKAEPQGKSETPKPETKPDDAESAAMRMLDAAPTDDLCSTIQSGLVVSADGEIVTSMVNIGDQKVGLFVEMPGGSIYKATRLGEDSQRDLLLLKIEAKGLPVPPMGSKADLAVGQWVVALGRTLPIPTPTANKGIVSALGRHAGVAIQTDTNISPVNYGGPLVDIRGRVVGLVAAVGARGMDSRAGQWSDSGIGFAVPIEDVMSRLGAMREGRHLDPPFLGIEFNMVRLESGAKIMRVIAATAASESGLQDGDVIIEFQGRPIETPFQLLYEIGSRAVGDEVTFKVQRDGETLTLKATLGARPAQYRN